LQLSLNPRATQPQVTIRYPNRDILRGKSRSRPASWQDITVASDLADFDIANLTDAALQAGSSAEHVDVRIMSTRTAYQTHRDRTAVADLDHCSTAIGVRVLRDGCWGFAATTSLDSQSAAAVAKEACELARVSAPAVTERVQLASEPTYVGEWTSQFDIDPFTLPATERMQFLESGCAQLLDSGAVDHANAAAMAVREETVYTDSSGTSTRQQRIRVHADFTGVAIAEDGSFESMRTTAPPVGRGWEYFGSQCQSLGGARSWDWQGELERLPERLKEKSTAPSISAGEYTLVLDPTNLWLTIHESIGHATELDRVRGYEANYAGTSFATQDQLGSLQYGSSLLNITGDRTADHGLATVAWDDEGVAAQEWPLISDGILVDYQLDRSMAGADGRRSNGCAYADSALRVPLQRMPNVSLQPNPDGGSLADLISGVEDGIYVVGDNSWSIDMQRYNFQFTGQRFERIQNGKLVGQVKDAAYQGSTPQFWGSLSALGGPETYLLGGAFNCGKGQPGQAAPVSHGCPAGVFSGVNVLNTRQEASA
jgi:TldD protein